MSKVLFRIFILTMFVMFSIFINGCTQNDLSNATGQLSPSNVINSTRDNSDKYIVITYYRSETGKLLEGKYPSMYIDFPTFSINRGEAVGFHGDINDSLIAIFVEGQYISGDVGEGGWNTARGIYELPYEDSGVKILNIYDNGTVFIEYVNKSIVLKPYEKWANETSTIESKKDSKGYYKINITTSYTIENYGYIKLYSPKNAQ